MHPERKHLETDQSLGAIEQALPGAKKTFLEEIRPADGRDEWLWAFNALSNLDKHNMIIPNIAVAQSVGSFRAGTSTFTNCGGGGNAANPCVLLSADCPITIEKDFETTVDVRFGKRDHVFENKAVIPTLTQIAGLVSGTIDEFERLINKTT